MKLTENIRDHRIKMNIHTGGSVVRRERKGIITGPYIVCMENDQRPREQDNHVNGMVHLFLVHLGTGYRAEIWESDVFFDVHTELVFKDPK